MKIAITGASGFIGKNFCIRLQELGIHTLQLIGHSLDIESLKSSLEGTDIIFHFAGVNRPEQPTEFLEGNTHFTMRLVDVLSTLSTPPRIVYTSSSQALLDNQYGRSKRDAEDILLSYGHATGAAVYIYRLPNVFGKWSRPNYNSVVATFCHHIARDLPIEINDADAPLHLVYIDDLVSTMLTLIEDEYKLGGFLDITPIYETTVGLLAEIIREFRDNRKLLKIPKTGTGLIRRLYSTYVSFIPSNSFSYQVPTYPDARGIFVEMLKTSEYGQISYFTAPPGVTRGEHYHHTKTEKFLIIKGIARFDFRSLLTDEECEVIAHGGSGHIVETIPGWIHNITNIGDEELIVLLWANEIFDRSRPDTVAMKVKR